MMVTTEEEMTQKNGMVAIIFHLSRLVYTNPSDRESLWAIIKLLREGLPYKPIGTHACYNNDYFRPMIALGQMAADTFARIRVRTHCGTLFFCFAMFPAFFLLGVGRGGVKALINIFCFVVCSLVLSILNDQTNHIQVSMRMLNTNYKHLEYRHMRYQSPMMVHQQLTIIQNFGKIVEFMKES